MIEPDRAGTGRAVVDLQDGVKRRARPAQAMGTTEADAGPGESPEIAAQPGGQDHGARSSDSR